MIEGADAGENQRLAESMRKRFSSLLVWLRRCGVTGMISRPELIARFRRKVRIVHGTNHADGALARGSGLDRTHPAPARKGLTLALLLAPASQTLWQRREWQCANTHDGVAVGCFLYQQFRLGCHR